MKIILALTLLVLVIAPDVATAKCKDKLFGVGLDLATFLSEGNKLAKRNGGESEIFFGAEKSMLRKLGFHLDHSASDIRSLRKRAFEANLVYRRRKDTPRGLNRLVVASIRASTNENLDSLFLDGSDLKYYGVVDAEFDWKQFDKDRERESSRRGVVSRSAWIEYVQDNLHALRSDLAWMKRRLGVSGALQTAVNYGNGLAPLFMIGGLPHEIAFFDTYLGIPVRTSAYRDDEESAYEREYWENRSPALFELGQSESRLRNETIRGFGDEVSVHSEIPESATRYHALRGAQVKMDRCLLVVTSRKPSIQKLAQLVFGESFEGFSIDYRAER